MTKLVRVFTNKPEWWSSLSCNLDFYIHIGPPFLQMLHVIFGFERPCGSKQNNSHKSTRNPITESLSDSENGFWGHFGPFILRIDIKHQCPVLKHQCYMPSVIEIRPVVPEKILEGILPYMGLGAIRPYDTTHRFPVPIDASYKIWL